jgi:YebC/PmpR family DNA-binding regulatory protein
MSGHSKWANIKHEKGAADAKRGKAFTRHAKLISVAAQAGGGDPNTNPTLRSAIDKAKENNVPNANIERAIKRGLGELKDQTAIEEVMYEGYGPCGVAIFIRCLTDNRNRTVSNLRMILSKNGGSLGDSGCVGWMFKRAGVIRIELPSPEDEEKIELLAIDAGATDVKTDDRSVTIQTTVENFEHIKNQLQKDYKVLSAGLAMLPDTLINIDNVDNARRLLKLIDTVEEDEDVADVYANFDILDNVYSQISQ